MKKEMLLQEIEEMSAELVSKFDAVWNDRDPDALENPPENADAEFIIIRTMLPEELFAGFENPQR